MELRQWRSSLGVHQKVLKGINSINCLPTSHCSLEILLSLREQNFCILTNKGVYVTVYFLNFFALNMYIQFIKSYILEMTSLIITYKRISEMLYLSACHYLIFRVTVLSNTLLYFSLQWLITAIYLRRESYLSRLFSGNPIIGKGYLLSLIKSVGNITTHLCLSGKWKCKWV